MNQLDGYMNADGSRGVFQYTYTPAGQATTELGLVLLVEI